jgi:hypothetical protein
MMTMQAKREKMISKIKKKIMLDMEYEEGE